MQQLNCTASDLAELQYRAEESPPATSLPETQTSFDWQLARVVQVIGWLRSSVCTQYA